MVLPRIKLFELQIDCKQQHLNGLIRAKSITVNKITSSVTFSLVDIEAAFIFRFKLWHQKILQIKGWKFSNNFSCNGLTLFQ